MKILIITGGSSSERKISLISARGVSQTLQSNGHRVTLFDFKKGFPSLKKLLPEYDIIFPIMHGYEGEDGTLYSFLRFHRKLYVGSDPKGAGIAFDKILFKRYCDKKKIPTPPWKIVKDVKAIKRFGFPCVLKGAQGGSSHEVILLYSDKNLVKPKVQKILSSKNGCFVEKLIEGPEITVGVLHGKPLPVLEIIPPRGEWFDYKNKYSGKTKEIPFPKSVSRSLQHQSQRTALSIHNNLKLGNFSRTDFIVKDNIPYVIEVNTPGGVGLTSESLFPKAAKAMGITFKSLVEKLIA